MVMRLYRLNQVALDGTWKPTGVKQPIGQLAM